MWPQFHNLLTCAIASNQQKVVDQTKQKMSTTKHKSTNYKIEYAIISIWVSIGHIITEPLLRVNNKEEKPKVESILIPNFFFFFLFLDDIWNLMPNSKMHFYGDIFLLKLVQIITLKVTLCFVYIYI